METRHARTPPLSNWQTRDIESVLHPYTPIHKLKQTGTMVIERGKGVYVYDSEGRGYIEGMSGLWCAGLGFGDEEMIEAATEQLRTLPYYHLFGAKGTEPSIELAEKLKEIAPVPISKVFFTSSGSEANDTQVKFAWYMNNALGRPKKKKIISRIKAYHGVTDHVGVADRPALQSHRLGPAGRPRAAHRLPALLPLRQGRRERGRIPGAHRAVAARPDRARGPGHDRRLHRRAGDGRRRRHHPAGGLLSRRSRTCSTSTTSS